jgi:hypothetical protein
VSPEIENIFMVQHLIKPSGLGRLKREITPHTFNALEDEMCLWVPGDPSPNRMDALVWALTELMLKTPFNCDIRFVDFNDGEDGDDDAA